MKKSAISSVEKDTSMYESTFSSRETVGLIIRSVIRMNAGFDVLWRREISSFYLPESITDLHLERPTIHMLCDCSRMSPSGLPTLEKMAEISPREQVI